MSEHLTDVEMIPRERRIELCASMLRFAAFAKRTEDRRGSEVKEALKFFFTDDVIKDAVADISGRPRTTETTPDGWDANGSPTK